MPPLPADSIHARACKLKCEKILTRPREVGYLFISHDRALCERFCTAIRPLEGGRLGEPV